MTQGRETLFPLSPLFIPSRRAMMKAAQMRMWRNWYTRTFEGRVALPCEFESRHPHLIFKPEKGGHPSFSLVGEGKPFELFC
jgi:hypothetical protein